METDTDNKKMGRGWDVTIGGWDVRIRGWVCVMSIPLKMEFSNL